MEHTYSLQQLLQFVGKRCAPQGATPCLQETEKQYFYALLETIAATLESGDTVERDALAASLRALQPALSVPVPHTVGIWLSRHVEDRIHPQALADATIPMVGFMIRAWCGDQPNEPSNTEWSHYLPLATVDLADWMDADLRWWTIFKAALDGVVALNLPHYLWPQSAHGHIAASVMERPAVLPRMTTRTELVPALALSGNRLSYILTEVTTVERAAA